MIILHNRPIEVVEMVKDGVRGTRLNRFCQRWSISCTCLSAFFFSDIVFVALFLIYFLLFWFGCNHNFFLPQIRIINKIK